MSVGWRRKVHGSSSGSGGGTGSCMAYGIYRVCFGLLAVFSIRHLAQKRRSFVFDVCDCGGGLQMRVLDRWVQLELLESLYMYQKCSVAAGLTMCLRARVSAQSDNVASEVLGDSGASVKLMQDFDRSRPRSFARHLR